MDSHIPSINHLLPTEPEAERGVPDEARRALQAALWECKRVVVGQDAMLERVLVALLCGGHVLLEGVPGLAKTLTVRTLAEVLGGSFNRVQFTPDLVPAEDVARLGQPFERLRRERGRGTGLGLSIVRAVAEAHGGRLTLEGPSTGGLIAGVRLPAVMGA